PPPPGATGEALRKTTPPPRRQGCPVPQDPTACTHPTRRPQSFQPPERSVLNQNPWPGCLCQCSTHEQPARTFASSRPALRKPQSPSELLLRKEVIQPHLPVRLPCYDLVLITDPTFDGSLHKGVRPPASGVTDLPDLQGGV